LGDGFAVLVLDRVQSAYISHVSVNVRMHFAQSVAAGTTLGNVRQGFVPIMNLPIHSRVLKVIADDASDGVDIFLLQRLCPVLLNLEQRITVLVLTGRAIRTPYRGSES
jgi:hypothetical protein